MKKIKFYFTITALMTITIGLNSCTQYSYQGSSFSDDLYGTVNVKALAKAERENAEMQAALVAAQRSKREAQQKIAQENAEINAILGVDGDLNLDVNPYQSENIYQEIIVDDFDGAYARRLKGFSSGTYNMPSSYYDYRYSDAYFLTAAFDPSFYNVIVMGSEVWVEPYYVTAMFGNWGRPYYQRHRYSPFSAWRNWHYSTLWGWNTSFWMGYPNSYWAYNSWWSPWNSPWHDGGYWGGGHGHGHGGHWGGGHGGGYGGGGYRDRDVVRRKSYGDRISQSNTSSSGRSRRAGGSFSSSSSGRTTRGSSVGSSSSRSSRSSSSSVGSSSSGRSNRSGGSSRGSSSVGSSSSSTRSSSSSVGSSSSGRSNRGSSSVGSSSSSRSSKSSSSSVGSSSSRSSSSSSGSSSRSSGSSSSSRSSSSSSRGSSSRR